MSRFIRSAAPLLLLCLAAILAGGGAGAATPATEFRLGVYLLASTVVFVDLFDFLLRLYQRRIQASPLEPPRTQPTSAPLDIAPFNPHQRKLHLQPYALAISVHDLGEELDAFVAAMEPYRTHLYVIDDASSDATPERLEAARIRVVRGARNRHKPGAIRELLHHLPADVRTVLVLDPDCRILEPGTSDISALENVIFEFQRSRCGAACPRIAVRRTNWLARFQRLEYVLAFAVGRKSLRDFSITSGIALYRRDVLERTLAQHSLSVYAEDLENTLLMISQREQVYYDERLVIETEGKETFSAWFSQRVGWSYGLAKVYLQNLRRVWDASRSDPMHFYQYLVYLGVFSIAFHPLKLASLIALAASALNGLDVVLGAGVVPDTALTNPWIFPVVYAKYTLLIAAVIPASAPRGERLEHLPAALLYLPYTLVHLLPTGVGYLNWLSLRLMGRRLYRDHFADDAHVHG